MYVIISAIFVIFTCAEAKNCLENGNLTTGTNCEDPQHCPSNLCPHNSTCEVTNNSYSCICPTGFTGNNCETILKSTNNCDPNPCQHDAICNDQNSSLYCSCSPGFIGVFCQINIDDCESKPCQNGGTCQDGVDEFKCSCPDEFMGKLCEEKYDACGVHRCENGGSCRSDGMSRNFNCSCVNGFEGQLCERNIDDCKDVQCEQFLTCFDLVEGYECRCPAGYKGDQCDEEIDFCNPNPCQHGGTCLNGLDNYTCICPSNFTGPNCDSDIDECESNPCGVGICKNSIGSFQCYCYPGYSGDRCSLNVDECLSAPCFNNGSCVDQVNGYTCKCAPGYTGVRCEIDIDECLSNPCYNNGSCVDGVGEYGCVCLAGFTGRDCEVDIDECLSQPCLNEGMCLDHVNGFTCNCSDTGFTGLICENNIDDCGISSCTNGGTCVDLIKDYQCNCYPAYTGKHCDVDIDECADHPCANEAMCLERSNYSYYTNNYLGLFSKPFSYETAHGYSCHCKDGFRGENCTENIDDCDPDPCVNGTCVDGINAYTCDCTSGFEGINCELEINECDRFKPCFNKSRCVNTIGDYICECGENFGGKNCSVELIGCHGNLCANNATCEAYLIGETNHSYNCLCDHGFYGRLCTEITTISLNRSQPISILSEREVSDYRSLSFRFRTTLKTGILFFARNSSTYVSVVLRDTALQMIFSLSNLDKKVFEVAKRINDGKWKFVEVEFNPKNVTLNFGLDREGEVLIELSHPTVWEFEEFFMGNSPVVIFDEQIPFVGCVQDVVYNGALVTPEVLVTTPGVSKGCLRTEQCLEDTCAGNGDCDDLWNTFTCDCRRPFLGQDCRESVTPATFGHENSTSSVSVVFRPITQEELQRYFNISLFVRTRKQDGVLFYLGKTNPANDVAFVAAELHDGIPVIFIKSGGLVNSYLPKTKRINNGYYHLVEIAIERHNGLKITITTTINSTLILNITSELTTDFVAETLYLGHVPGIEHQRLKRQNPDWFNTNRNPQVHLPYDVITSEENDGNTHHEYATIMPLEFHENSDLFTRNKPKHDFSITNSPNPKILTESTFIPFKFEELTSGETTEFEFKNYPFKGVLQDVRVNDKSVLFYSMTIPHYNSFDGYENVTRNNIEKGVVSDNNCKSRPCKSGGRCNITWNDYECVCVGGYRGKNCSDVDFCFNKSCPGGARCVNLVDDFECITNATFTGNTSYISYQSNLPTTNITTISFKYRTQQPGAIFIATDSHQNRHFAIYLNTTGITLYYPSSSLDFFPIPKNLTDGLPHNIVINLNIKNHLLNIKFDDFETEIKSKDDSEKGFEILNNAEINIGGNSNKMFTDWNFKGCLSEISLNSYILPFFTAEEQEKNASLVRFSIKKIENVSKGSCVLCFDENCQNGGTCENPHESFDCKCDGFTGQFCEFDIDECLTTDCNNGICVNKKGSFDCVCHGGYEGKLCDEDEDECTRSEPYCENGGICTNLVGSASCNCSANFTGDTCEQLAIITCENNPCQNNGECIPNNNSGEQTAIIKKYNCSCTAGYTGHDCEFERDFCDPPRCSNKGNCTNDPPNGKHHCKCELGYEGLECEIDINECKTEPCFYGGTCIDGINSYTCVCSTGFSGFDCSIDVDECEDFEPCNNSAECVNKNGSYECLCPEGFFGKNCSHEDPCISDYICANEGICVQNETTGTELLYTCACLEPFYGQHCEIQAEEAFDVRSLAIILGPVVGCILLITVVAIVIFFMMARKKRATRGTYSPSRQEMFGSRVELGHVMKPPPEERLI